MRLSFYSGLAVLMLGSAKATMLYDDDEDTQLIQVDAFTDTTTDVATVLEADADTEVEADAQSSSSDDKSKGKDQKDAEKDKKDKDKEKNKQAKNEEKAKAAEAKEKEKEKADEAKEKAKEKKEDAKNKGVAKKKLTAEQAAEKKYKDALVSARKAEEHAKETLAKRQAQDKKLRAEFEQKKKLMGTKEASAKTTHKNKLNAMKKKHEEHTKKQNTHRHHEITKLSSQQKAHEKTLEDTLEKKKEAIKKQKDARAKHKANIERLVNIEKKKRRSQLVKHSRCPAIVYGGLNKDQGKDAKPTKKTKVDKKTVAKITDEVIMAAKRTKDDAKKIEKEARDIADHHDVQVQAVALGIVKAREAMKKNATNAELVAQGKKYLQDHAITKAKPAAKVTITNQDDKHKNYTIDPLPVKGKAGKNGKGGVAIDKLTGMTSEHFGERHGCGRDLRDLTKDEVSTLTNIAFQPDKSQVSGAQGKPMPTPTPAPKPAPAPVSSKAQVETEEIEEPTMGYDLENALF